MVFNMVTSVQFGCHHNRNMPHDSIMTSFLQFLREVLSNAICLMPNYSTDPASVVEVCGSVPKLPRIALNDSSSCLQTACLYIHGEMKSLFRA